MLNNLTRGHSNRFQDALDKKDYNKFKELVEDAIIQQKSGKEGFPSVYLDYLENTVRLEALEYLISHYDDLNLVKIVNGNPDNRNYYVKKAIEKCDDKEYLKSIIIEITLGE